MAEVFPWCNDSAAHSRDSRRGMQAWFAVLYARALSVPLRGPYSQGHSEVRWEHFHIDYYIILDDDRGQKAAAAIEYGRKGGRGGATAGKRILQTLMGG